MDDRNALLRHFLAAIAYRTQKALRGCSESFPSFRAAPQTRTPLELVRHMNSVLGYARTFFRGGAYRPSRCRISNPRCGVSTRRSRISLATSKRRAGGPP